jgi:hypothetical protein
LLRTCIHANQNRKKTGIVKAPSIIRRIRYDSKQRLKQRWVPKSGITPENLFWLAVIDDNVLANPLFDRAF